MVCSKCDNNIMLRLAIIIKCKDYTLSFGATWYFSGSKKKKNILSAHRNCSVKLIWQEVTLWFFYWFTIFFSFIPIHYHWLAFKTEWKTSPRSEIWRIIELTIKMQKLSNQISVRRSSCPIKNVENEAVYFKISEINKPFNQEPDQSFTRVNTKFD